MVKLGKRIVTACFSLILACGCLLFLLFKQSKEQSYFILGSSPLYAVKGGSYRLTCIIDGNIPPGIQFVRGSQVVCTIILVDNNCLSTDNDNASVTDSRYQCTCNRQQVYLNIADVTTADDAVWACTNNQGGGSGDTLDLPVYYGPESVDLNPTTIPPVIEDDDMTSVTCSATCKPTCLFTWIFGSSVVPSSDGILHLSNISRTQAGMYTCQAKHPVLSTRLSTNLTVSVYYGPDYIQFKPDITSITVTEGDSPVITCSADCVPSCDIKWKKGNSEISSDGKLSLPNITKTQHGIYVCTVTNLQIPTLEKRKTLRVNVNYGPNGIQFKPDNTGITVTEGDNPVITCSAECRPSCDIKWKKGNSEISSDGKLALPNITKTQHGIYVCIVTNLQIPNSEKRKTLTVNVNVNAVMNNRQHGHYSTISSVLIRVMCVYFIIQHINT